MDSRINRLFAVLGHSFGEGENQNPEKENQNSNQEITFTPEQQDKLNSIVAEEKRKYQEKFSKLESELNKSKDAIKDKEALATQLDELKRSFMTKEELAKADAEKLQNKYNTDLAAAQSEAANYKNLFENTLARQAIAQAAVEHKAFSASQLELLLLNQVKVVPVTDDDGKVTGFNVTAPVKVKDKVLELPIKEAVEKLRDNPEFSNLFLVDGTPGTGRTMNLGGGNVSNGSKIPPSDPSAYREWRKNQGITK